MYMSQDARLEEELNAQRRSRILGLPYIDTTKLANKQLYLQFLTVPELYSARVIPLMADQSNVTFGITNTTSQQTLKDLQQHFGDYRVSFALISDTSYNDYMKLYDPPKEVKYDDIQIKPIDTTTNLQANDLASISATLSQVRADDMLAYLVKQAYQLKASDIHLETSKGKTRIRFRVDGVLHAVAELPEDKYRLLIGSVASAANISTVSADAQTGHIERTYRLADNSEVTANLRVETVPTVHGQDAVLRLFNFRTEFLRLESLGLTQSEQSVIGGILRHPTGLVLIVGPTGSGKTTTLYSMVNELNNPERKIITLEDPVEYVIDGITQIPVDSRSEKEGFASKLRAVLRLDPDVIMVGEIRDLDTAKTALQSSLTGHLVLSTYHASSSAAALTRMLDAIGENPLFINSIRLITSQRLIRKLDDATKQAYEPDEAVKILIWKIVDGLPEGVDRPNLDNITLYKPGTSSENPFGFTGQIAIREFMLMNPELQTILRRPAREVTTNELEQAAIRGGMITLQQAGVLKALKGETTIEEVFRVIG
ncbi:type II/IV secretion system protein [Candidatus Saccharibacteria bacterium]|nr:type II/IV secretion system protein [Candidatus Saccharibacteria bacterium]